MESRQSIIRRAIETFAARGYEAATFEAIARNAGVSRPLVTHYFKRKEQLFESCVQQVGAEAQAYVQARLLEAEPRPWSYLQAYVRANLAWAAQRGDHLRFWILFGLLCTWDRKLKSINTGFRRTGQERIIRMVRAGQESGEFSVEIDAATTGKLLHDFLSSRVLAFATESDGLDPEQAVREMLEVFARILFKSSRPVGP